MLIPADNDGCFYTSNACRMVTFEVASTEQQILYEVPAVHYKCREEGLRLHVTLAPEAVSALLSLKKAIPNMDSDGTLVKKAQQSGSRSFHYQSFTNSEKGRAAIRDYMSVMKRRYEELRGRDLVTDQGVLSDDTLPNQPWADIVTKGTLVPHGDTQVKARYLHCNLPAATCHGATTGNGWQKFHKFLHEVHSHGPEAVASLGSHTLAETAGAEKTSPESRAVYPEAEASSSAKPENSLALDPGARAFFTS